MCDSTIKITFSVYSYCVSGFHTDCPAQSNASLFESLNIHPVAARIATFSGASQLCDVRKPNSVLAYVDFTSVNNC